MGKTVNLDTNASKKINQQFTAASYVKGRLSASEDFIGAKTVRLHTINTVPLTDYSRTAGSNRYGTPSEVSDTIQEMTLSEDKSFSGIIDKGNNLDQSINKAGKFMRVEMDEEVIPAYDRYCLNRLAAQGGKIVGSGTALSAANVIARLSAARAHFLNHRVPTDGRTLYCTTEVFNCLVDTDQFKNLAELGGKAIAKGQVGEVFGAAVVEVPADLMPANVNFILVHKRAATAPEKIHDAKTHIDPPGISGNLCEGRFYYDLFVYGPKADGVYVDVTTGSGAATVCAAPTIAAATGVITPGSGYTSVYTTDGSDPRYSASAQTGTAPTVVAGDVVKAYNKKDKAYNSDVVTVTVTG